MKWIEDVKNALIELGGEAKLAQIYEVVRKNRTQRNDTIGRLESWVRNCLQNNSRGKGRDVFEPVYPVELRRGIWRLK